MYDIVFISYHEVNAEENYYDLYSRFNTVGVFGDRVKRVKDVKGIHNAHVAAAKLVNSNYFFVVDGDAVIVDEFDFGYTTREKDIVHVWRSQNPINDLVYGYGGVKLLPTTLTCNMDTTTNDMTTSISNKFKATTQDILDIDYNNFCYKSIRSNGSKCDLVDTADTIINTSCEHILDFANWYDKIPKGKLVVLQSNDFIDVDEHVNCVKDSLHFEQMAPLSKVLFTGELDIEKYTRYMRIGIR